MKGKNLKERGITLIALVITIIVLLILAGVTISIVLHTGIIDNSQKAVNTYQAQAKNETETLDYLQDKFGLYISYLDNINGKENQKIITDKEYAYYNPVIPVGFKAVNTENASWKIVEDKELGKIVEGWNDGLVIEDKDGNQFVWVPCYISSEKDEEIEDIDKLVEYKKTLGQQNYVITDLTQVQEEYLPEGINEESQIKKYGGFYIARYEAGIPESLPNAIKPKPEQTPENKEDMEKIRNVQGVPVSKKNQVPWNDITYTQAKLNAESMYNNDKIADDVKNKVKSGLVTGTMWDTTLSWLEKTGSVKDDEINNNSTSWGNYRDSTIPRVTLYSVYDDFKTGIEWIEKTSTKPDKGSNAKEFYWLLKTGNTEYTKRNNIYDLAGNVSEWTTEFYNSSERMPRGGCIFHYGQQIPVSFRNHYVVTTATGDFGFRVALYISAE